MKGLFFNVNLQLNFQTELILQLEKVSFFFFYPSLFLSKSFLAFWGFLEEKQKCYHHKDFTNLFCIFFFAYIINSASFSFASFLFGFAEFFT